ncbi:MAG: histone deacetylase [Thermodesulfobacteriota bacterium]
MTSVNDVTIIYDPCYLDHDTGGDDHPEQGARLETILAYLSSCEDLAFCYKPPRPALREEILAAHDESWLNRFEEAVLSGRTFIDHSDNQIGYESYQVAQVAAGAGLVGVDCLESGEETTVFCMGRPPGHHAERNMPFGFCFFNNCVIAARYWATRYGRKRVAIFDFDAHHGNGIQSAFEEEPDTIYISIHEHPSFSYPGTGYHDEVGLGSGRGTILNLTLPPGGGDREMEALLTEQAEPFLVKHQADALVISAGFDGHVNDDMSGLHYTTDLYRTIGSTVRRWGHDYCDGRLLSILEGGYELSVLGESVAAYLIGLSGRSRP